MHVDWDPPHFQSSSVLYITPTCTPSMHELIKQGMKQKQENPAFDARRTLVESNYLLQPPKYWIIVVNRFRYINNNLPKRCSIPMDMTVVLGLHKCGLQATIDHHGPSIYSGHYTASINYSKRTFYCNDSKITEFKTIDTKNSSTAYVATYKLITPMAMTHPLHPIKNMSRNERRNQWAGWCVSSWRPWFWPMHSIYYMHTTHYCRILTY